MSKRLHSDQSAVVAAGGDLRFSSATSTEPPSAASGFMNAYFDSLMVLAATDPEVSSAPWMDDWVLAWLLWSMLSLLCWCGAVVCMNLGAPN